MDANQFSGKLLLKHEWNLDDELFELWLQKKWIQEVPGIVRKFGVTMCQRCFNTEKKYFGLMPGDITYCRKCVAMGRLSEREPLYRWSGPENELEPIPNSCAWEGKLTPLQEEAAHAIVRTIQTKKRLLISAVCGAGKTEMLYKGIEYAAEHGLRLCIATPRQDVVRELAPRLRRDFPSLTSAALYGDSTERDHGAHLVIATTHQMLRYQNAFDVIIVDEVDAFPFHKDRSLPKAVNRALKPKHALIYLTATPRFNLKLQTALKLIPTVSIPMRYHEHPLPVPTFKRVHQLEKQLQAYELPKLILDWIEERKGRRFLLFTPTIELAQTLSQSLSIPYVHSESPDRKELVMKFRTHQLNALITTTILERGVTFPSIDVAVLLADHHVFDEAALVQIAGRVGRSADDPTGDITFFYEQKTNAMVAARQYTRIKNKEAQRKR
ncbi:DEAD/DEAH box helicase [Aquisalibacillus elongatus]|uniref:Competence protein ComFA n=1 Tax=Aquisalibacillus elongatus TaxID=485577 RepID=A0A3N5CBU2_9BACI|nr:helicase-related protein [Aquisalibacillus elongatus]RPF54351.1 competence protein ComFA [Aquisalibacillus elongatus]